VERLSVWPRLRRATGKVFSSSLALGGVIAFVTADAAAPATAHGVARATASRLADFAGGPAGWSRAAWRVPLPSGIDTAVVDLALGAASCAARAGFVDAARTLTVIDFSRPSTERRLWVFALATGDVLHHERVAHGSGSGGDRAVSFSNVPDSRQSSLGLFRAAEPYRGRHGYSLRLDGLDEGFNDRARDRAIVVHGADYVSDEFVEANGRLGRSWGCPALGPDVAATIIDRIKGDGLVFAFYPDAAWLNGSPLLGECRAAEQAR
jgi:hypothetical protein